MIDWQLMQDTIWRNTEAEPDRVERRMAEFLVHGRVPWEAFLGVAVRTEEHRVAHAEHVGVSRAADAAKLVGEWSPRKERLFTGPHVETAWRALQAHGWLPSRSPTA